MDRFGSGYSSSTSNRSHSTCGSSYRNSSRTGSSRNRNSCTINSTTTITVSTTNSISSHLSSNSRGISSIRISSTDSRTETWLSSIINQYLVVWNRWNILSQIFFFDRILPLMVWPNLLKSPFAQKTLVEINIFIQITVLDGHGYLANFQVHCAALYESTYSVWVSIFERMLRMKEADWLGSCV